MEEGAVYISLMNAGFQLSPSVVARTALLLIVWNEINPSMFEGNIETFKTTTLNRNLSVVNTKN